MKETWAEELKRVQVRVTSTGQYFYELTFTRMDTGEVIENIYKYSIEGEAGNLSWLTLCLVHVVGKEIQHEAVMLSTVELDIVTRTNAQDIKHFDTTCIENDLFPTY